MKKLLNKNWMEMLASLDEDNIHSLKNNIPDAGGSAKESFIDNIILNNEAQIKVAECNDPAIKMAIAKLIVAINYCQEGSSRAIEGKRRQNIQDYYKIVEYIDGFSSEVIDMLHFEEGVWEYHTGNTYNPNRDSRHFKNLNDRTIIKQTLYDLYKALDNYPLGYYRLKELDVSMAEEYFPNPPNEPPIPIQTQLIIVYEIFKYTDFEDAKFNNYSEREFVDVEDKLLKQRERLFYFPVDPEAPNPL